MRHRIFGKQLGRTHNQRQALLNGLVRAFFTHGAIQTTQAKAQSVAGLVEKLCTTALKGDLVARHQLFRYFQDRNVVNNVVKVMGENFSGQNGNFTRTTKVKYRQGDNALIVKLAFLKPVKFTVEKVEEVKEVKAKETKIKPVAKVKSVKVKKASDET